MIPIQDTTFLNSEGDNYFLRNKDHMSIQNDPVLKIIDLYKLVPENVLEVGACNGFRLASLMNAYQSTCVAVEPSELAIKDGKLNHPCVRFIQSTASNLPLESESFDLVIINYVLHWVDRSQLLRSIAEIDRVLKPGGFVVIGDFAPNQPIKVDYHHLKGLWTYKQDYTQILLATNLYYSVGYLTNHHDTHSFDSDIGSYDRSFVALLRKKETYNV